MRAKHVTHVTNTDARTSGLIPTPNDTGGVPAPGAPSPVQRPPGVLWIPGHHMDNNWPDESLDLLDDFDVPDVHVPFYPRTEMEVLR